VPERAESALPALDDAPALRAAHEPVDVHRAHDHVLELALDRDAVDVERIRRAGGRVAVELELDVADEMLHFLDRREHLGKPALDLGVVSGDPAGPAVVDPGVGREDVVQAVVLLAVDRACVALEQPLDRVLVEQLAQLAGFRFVSHRESPPCAALRAQAVPRLAPRK